MLLGIESQHGVNHICTIFKTGEFVRPVAAALQDIIDGSDELRFGFYRRLFNLTQLATFLQPLIEARTKKEVQTSSLVMAMSRLAVAQERSGRVAKRGTRFELETVSIRMGLMVCTLNRSSVAHRAVQQLYPKVKKSDGYLTTTEGTREITVILQQSDENLLLEALSDAKEIIQRRGKVAALGVHFNKKFLHAPGFLQTVLHHIALQGINVVEIASTATELVIYVDEVDARLGLDSLLRAFVHRSRWHLDSQADLSRSERVARSSHSTTRSS